MRQTVFVPLLTHLPSSVGGSLSWLPSPVSGSFVASPAPAPTVRGARTTYPSSTSRKGRTMTTYLPTLPVKDVTINGQGFEFIGHVCVFYCGDSYVIPMNFVGQLTVPASKTPGPITGEWGKGPIFNKLKRLCFSDKAFLARAKDDVRKLKAFMKGQNDGDDDHKPTPRHRGILRGPQRKAGGLLPPKPHRPASSGA